MFRGKVAIVDRLRGRFNQELLVANYVFTPGVDKDRWHGRAKLISLAHPYRLWKSDGICVIGGKDDKVTAKLVGLQGSPVLIVAVDEIVEDGLLKDAILERKGRGLETIVAGTWLHCQLMLDIVIQVGDKVSVKVTERRYGDAPVAPEMEVVDYSDVMDRVRARRSRPSLSEPEPKLPDAAPEASAETPKLDPETTEPTPEPMDPETADDEVDEDASWKEKVDAMSYREMQTALTDASESGAGDTATLRKRLISIGPA